MARTILVTGATGVVGAELLRRLRRLPDTEVVGVSRRGDATVGVIPWVVGRDPQPRELPRHWDVIIHSAAATRWTLPRDEAWLRNVEATAAALDLAGTSTQFVYVSTMYARGRGTGSDVRDLSNFHNTYEWSKANAEVLVRRRISDASIIRIPLVIGRRTDGRVARFTGIYRAFRAAVGL